MNGTRLGDVDNQPAEWEKTENPQMYQQSPFYYVHKNAARPMLGLVGGNEVSLIKGNLVDLESDLRGINLPNTFCPQRGYQAPKEGVSKIVRENVKTKQTIDTRPRHLPAVQPWAYPVVMGPKPLQTSVCKNPERY
jgi:hypothetical protein